MKTRPCRVSLTNTLLGVSATAALLCTSVLPVHATPPEHLRYKLIDLGTFGGPSSNLATSNGVTSPGAVNQILNNHGTAVGWGDTGTLDPLAPNCFSPFNQDCFLPHAFQR